MPFMESFENEGIHEGRPPSALPAPFSSDRNSLAHENRLHAEHDVLWFRLKETQKNNRVISFAGRGTLSRRRPKIGAISKKYRLQRSDLKVKNCKAVILPCPADLMLRRSSGRRNKPSGYRCLRLTSQPTATWQEK
jgi:hypothetical protein